MAPIPITEDYYLVLEVTPTATPKQIRDSYKRLAWKLHPDRSAKNGSTQEFQLLSEAYETLSSESKRREYDLVYPTLRKTQPGPRSTQTSYSNPTSTAQEDILREATQLNRLKKTKEENFTRWSIRRNAYESSIFEQQRKVRRLVQEIDDLASIVAAEAAEEAQKNSWSTWLLSPLYKKIEESEEEKALKDRQRQERRIEKDLKERRLEVRQTQLRSDECALEEARQEHEDVIRRTDQEIVAINARAWDRETRARQEREKVERERLARIRKQQQEQQQKDAQRAREELQKQQAAQAAERARRQERERLERERLMKNWMMQKEHEEREAEAAREVLRALQANRRRQRGNAGFVPDQNDNGQTAAHICGHGGWWDKIQGRSACPECDDVWTYLLECPSCQIQACPKCQNRLRPRSRRNMTRYQDRPRTPSPTYIYWDD